MRTIPLSNGMEALIDDEDYDLVEQFAPWSAKHHRNTWYAVGHAYTADAKRITIQMHRLIMGCKPEDPAIDHRNGNGLDNQRGNLRPTTGQRNKANSAKQRLWKGQPTSSRYKGVSWRKESSKWHAVIGINWRHRHLGLYDVEEDAARAYDKAALEAWGSHARLNFPVEDESETPEERHFGPRPLLFKTRRDAVKASWTDRTRIPLLRGLEALVSEEDFDRLMAFNWYAAEQQRAGTFYAIASARRPDGVATTISMHRFIMECKLDDPDVDHVNGNGLDNRRENLRFATDSQNGGNRRKARSRHTSQFKGVYREQRGSGKWRSSIRVGGQLRHLGSFATEEEAALAYDEAALEAWGEFAKPNAVESLDT